MLLYNGDFILEKELSLPLSNRAFQYNDGFFETVVVVNGKLRFWGDHVARLHDAAKSMKLQLPSSFSEAAFEDKLLQLAEQNGAGKYGRLKLKIWRSGAGLYTPETSTVEWLATVAPTVPTSGKSISIGICQSIKTISSPLSHFKGPNAAIYVMAGVEKQQTNYNDMLLLNAQGMVAELISSNIFWLMDGKLFTPALDTGCVNGIVRRNIVRWCHSNSIKLQEAYFTPQRLLQAEAVFAANVTGIKSINSINGEAVSINERFIEQLRLDLDMRV
ncbi:aminotransferase class IV [uncultured Pontibacter sp.]|uniref:aminotransferase class IV n=1 Tax=uncultured Pontibacter sp. TaxID=453356 RepID=UPI0026188E22|nr:aminotransferase class IV [uncultured Pontibacter sp.]